MTTFLNTDLDVVSDRDLTVLVDAFARGGVVHALCDAERGDDGEWSMTFEAFASPHTPESTTRALLDAIEALDGPARDLWLACRMRAIDLGFEAGTVERVHAELSPDTVARVAAAGLAIRVTIYPALMESASPSASGSRSSS